LVLIVSNTAVAATESTVSISRSQDQRRSALANINQNNVELGGTIDFGYSVVGGSLFQINPTVRYFVIDRLALGVTGNFITSAVSTYLNMGPSVVYHFWSNERVSTYVGQDFLYNLNEYNDYSYNSSISTRWTSETKLGMNYFITPVVAFGPRVSYLRNFASDVGAFTLAAAFSLYF